MLSITQTTKGKTKVKPSANAKAPTKEKALVAECEETSYELYSQLVKTLNPEQYELLVQYSLLSGLPRYQLNPTLRRILGQSLKKAKRLLKAATGSK
jgi:hypothetical protein